MPKLIHPRYQQGLAAYRAGHGIGHVMEVTNEIENEFERSRSSENLTEEQRDALYKERHDAAPSLMAGFADGLIEDIRFIANRRRDGGKA